jgi:hypothetical protein
MAVLRRRRLQQRFGPEYDRVVGERDSRRKAEAELAEREHRVEDLDIQPLTDSARAGRGDQPEAAGTASTEDLRGPWSTTVPCSVTSSASLRIPDPNQPPPRKRASNSPNLVRRRWRNDLTIRALP